MSNTPLSKEASINDTSSNLILTEDYVQLDTFSTQEEIIQIAEFDILFYYLIYYLQIYVFQVVNLLYLHCIIRLQKY